MIKKSAILLALRLLGTALPLAFAALLGMKELGWPTEDFGDRGAWRDTIAALAIATVVFGLAGWLAEGLTRRGLRKERRIADLEDLCRLAVYHVHRKCAQIPIQELGAHVWLVRKPRSWKGTKLEPRLENAALFSILGRPASPVMWTEGKGAIGTAWRDREPVLVDLDQKVWAGARLRKDPEFNALPTGDRLGMTARDVRRTSRYRAIGAFPLAMDGGATLLGVFSIDCSQRGVFTCVRAALTNDSEFSDILGTCESVLRGD